MAANEEAIRAVAALSAQHLGVNDPTLAEYLVSLWLKDPQSLSAELREFPPEFADSASKAIRIAMQSHCEVNKSSNSIERSQISVGQTHAAVVQSHSPDGGTIVRLQNVKPSTDGILRFSNTREKHEIEALSVLQQVLVRVESIHPAISFSIAETESRSPHRESDERHSTIDLADDPKLVLQRTIPNFLRGYVANSSLLMSKNTPSALPSSGHGVRQGALIKAASKATEQAQQRKKHIEHRGKMNPTTDYSLLSAPRNVDNDLSNSRGQLPVYAFRSKFLETIADNSIVIVVGDTGSGKTTQLPHYLKEAGYGERTGSVIACTQPRRVAAMSIAKRVAEESGVPKVGELVGYAVRFDERTSPNTRIKYMTDGLLQREITTNSDLSGYAAVMIDEAHERTVATDVLLALLKQAVVRRPDLKVVIASATLDASRFSEYLFHAPILHVPGRTHPVEIIWEEAPVLDYLDAALSKVMNIHETKPAGDILVFLTGQEEIDAAVEQLRRMARNANVADLLIVLPVYSALPAELQGRIFEPAPAQKRKIILATNIAETSLTIDGVVYVVDPGFSKVMAWDPRRGMERLMLTPISQAQAAQRAGRAGRTRPGICYRLYTRESFEGEMPLTPVPAIQRTNLAHTLLLLHTMGVRDPLTFDFFDRPPMPAIVSALDELFQLGALSDDSGDITTLGRRMAQFPLDPAMARTLLAATETGVANEVSIILAMLGAPTVWYRPSQPPALRAKADRAHDRLRHASGDHMTLLNIYQEWSRQAGSAKRRWCKSNFLHDATLRIAQEARKQLLGLIKTASSSNEEKPDATTVLQAFCSGYFRNSAQVRDGGKDYETLIDQQMVSPHPSSSLRTQSAEYVIYHSLIFTSREYMSTVSAVKPQWLANAAPHLFGVEANRSKVVSGLRPLRTAGGRNDDSWRLSKRLKRY